MIVNLLPEGFAASSAILLILASFFTSGLTAAVGVGGGLTMLGIMTYLVPIQALIPVHGLVQLGSNASRVWVLREHINLPVVALFLAGSLVGAVCGALIYVDLSQETLQLILGGFLLVLLWVRMPAFASENRITVILGGGISQFASMFVGATGPLAAAFLGTFLGSHKQVVATNGAVMTLQHGLKSLAFIGIGFAFAQWVPLLLAMSVSAYLGTRAGALLINRLPERFLKFTFKAILTVIALDLIRKSLGY